MLFEFCDNMLYADAVKSKHFGYSSMHYTIEDPKKPYYVEGELFEKFATGVQDEETAKYVYNVTRKLYKAEYGREYKEEWK